MPRTKKLTTIIGSSIDRTYRILFKPFSGKKWLRLTLIGLLAGVLAFGFNIPGSNLGHKKKTSLPAYHQKIASTTTQTAPVAAQAEPVSPRGSIVISKLRPKMRNFFRSKGAPVVLAIILIAIIFMIFWTWLICRFQFVWFHAIAAENASISEPFQRHKREAGSFFWAIILFDLVLIPVILFFVGWFWEIILRTPALGAAFSWHLLLRSLGVPIAAALFVGFGFFLAAAVMHQFIISVMALDGVNFWTAARKIGGIFTRRPADFFIFYAGFFALLIPTALITFVVVLVSLLLFLLGGAILYFLGYALFVLALKSKGLLILYCVLVAIPYFIVCGLLYLFARLPIPIFIRAFSIEFLLALNEGYSEETLSVYSNERSENPSKGPIIFLIIILTIFFVVFFFGLLAAIAVPNFVAARKAALAAKQSSLSQPVSAASVFGASALKNSNDDKKERDLDSYYKELGIKRDHGSS